MSPIHRAATAFQLVADVYDRGRPDYPEYTIAALVAGVPKMANPLVIDVAAGTGKLTAHLRRHFRSVLAVEPVEAFRHRCAQAIPDAAVVAAVAERLPVGSSTAAAINVGQAFHWFDGAAALEEFHRVLVQGGSLGLIWNVRSATSPLHREVTEVLNPYRDRAPTYATGAWRQSLETTDLFTPLTETVFEWERRVDRQTFLDRFRSVSVIAEMDTDVRAAVITQLDTLFDRYAVGPSVVAPYETHVFTTAAL